MTIKTFLRAMGIPTELLINVNEQRRNIGHVPRSQGMTYNIWIG